MRRYLISPVFSSWTSVLPLDVPLVLKKKGNPTRKTFAMWKIARIGQGNHKKAWKQEIRREHNSNPLQRHEHVQYIVYRLCSRSIYQLPSTTSFHAGHQYGPCMLLRMDGLCVPVLNTACIRNINSSQIIMIICPHIPKWMYNKRIGHHPPVKIAYLYYIGRENMENYQYMFMTL